MLERISFTKIFNQEYFLVYDLSYDLQTYVKQSASYVTVTDQFQVKVKSPVFQDKSLISYTHLRNISDFKMTSDSNTNCITMETIEQEIADELILNTINTIRKNRKRPDTSSTHEYLQKKLNNSDVTAEIIESRLSFLTKKNRIENKLTNGKSSYFIKDHIFLNGPTQPNISDKSSPLSCKTSSDVKIIKKQISENAISLLEDKITSLEEIASVLNKEIIALRSFIIEQQLVIKKLRKKHPQSVHHNPKQIDSKTK